MTVSPYDLREGHVVQVSLGEGTVVHRKSVSRIYTNSRGFRTMVYLVDIEKERPVNYGWWHWFEDMIIHKILK